MIDINSLLTQDTFTFETFGLTKEQILTKINNSVGNYSNCITVNGDCLDYAVVVDSKSIGSTNIRMLISKLFTIFTDNIYAEKDITIGERAMEYLMLTKRKIGIAESITGGIISDMLISNDGASEVVSEGIVSYSNFAKISRLAVKPQTLDEYTAVSEPVAYQMVSGLLKQDYNDIGLSTTGYATYCGILSTKGLVYIGIGDRDKIKVYRHIFQGERNEIRKTAANAALFYLIKKIKGKLEV